MKDVFKDTDINKSVDNGVKEMMDLFTSFHQDLRNSILSGFLKNLKNQTQYNLNEYYKGLEEIKPDVEKVEEELDNIKLLLKNLYFPHHQILEINSSLIHNAVIQINILQTLKDETGSEYIHPAKINKTT